MDSLGLAKKRLKTFLDEIRQLQGAEFPYRHSREALDQIYQTFDDHLRSLLQLTPEHGSAIVETAIRRGVGALYVYLPVLGFILRSTNVRNAFEIHGPLLRLSRQILGPSTRLVVSSEWDYSPFTYLGIPVLRGYVLIGLPAPESGNPLLLPLAGHELGHSVWRQKSVLTAVNDQIKERILSEIKNERWDEYIKLFPKVDKDKLTTDLFTPETWEPAYSWATRQAEESFCDFFGLRLFGGSFLHAFAYLLTPNQGGQRPLIYPNTRQRVMNLVTAAKDFTIVAPDDYEKLFEDLPEPDDREPRTKFLLKLADTAYQSVVPILVEQAKMICDEAVGNEAGNEQTVYETFERHIVPCEEAESLKDVLNAAWKAFQNPDLWADQEHIRPEDKDHILKELVLKNIEVLEYKHITTSE